MRQSLRRDDLCSVQGCDQHIEVRDEQGFLVRRERCALCPLDKLDAAVAAVPDLPRAYDFDFALTAGVNITLDEINALEFRCLKVLRIERDKHQAEQVKRPPKE